MIGGWLGDRDFGACGGTILGKNAPAKEAPPLSPHAPPSPALLSGVQQ